MFYLPKKEEMKKNDKIFLLGSARNIFTDSKNFKKNTAKKLRIKEKKPNNEHGDSRSILLVPVKDKRLDSKID